MLNTLYFDSDVNCVLTYRLDLYTCRIRIVQISTSQ